MNLSRLASPSDTLPCSLNTSPGPTKHRDFFAGHMNISPQNRQLHRHGLSSAIQKAITRRLWTPRRHTVAEIASLTRLLSSIVRFIPNGFDELQPPSANFSQHPTGQRPSSGRKNANTLPARDGAMHRVPVLLVQKDSELSNFSVKAHFNSRWARCWQRRDSESKPSRPF